MRNFFYILFSIILFSCAAEKPKENILPKDKFVSLLIQMHLLDARISFSQTIDMQAKEKNAAVYDALLNQHGTDSLVVARTFDYYHDRPEELLVIYQEVQDSLVARAKKTVKPK